VPAGLTVTAVSTSRGSCVFGAEVVCTIGALPVGTTAVITVDVIADPTAPPP
jgi:hypothetical protein